MIQVYAPTSSTDDKVKEDFYKLQETVDQCHQNDMTVVIGDLSAKVRRHT